MELSELEKKALPLLIDGDPDILKVVVLYRKLWNNLLGLYREVAKKFNEFGNEKNLV